MDHNTLVPICKVGTNPRQKLTTKDFGICGELYQKLWQFTQLKRNKRFDNFIMLVWVQGSQFQIDAGLLPVQEAGGGVTR